jgi:ATP-dependent helicase/nuclease subunit A
VSANAGAGKTHVLAQRVLRLLLGGAPPGRLLCLTFTKAAAANMAERVFTALANWTQLADSELRAAILSTGAAAPDATRLAFARRLFARTIETPGGLKIQTIHAFCERLLHMFPFEANVAAGFRIAEEREAARLLERARAEGLAAFLKAPGGEARLDFIGREAGVEGFDKLLREGLGLRRKISQALREGDDLGGFGESLAARLGLAPGETESDIVEAMLEGLGGRRNWPVIAGQMETGGPRDKALAAALRDASAALTPAAALAAYRRVFFILTGDARGGAQGAVVSQTVQRNHPELPGRLLAEQARLVALDEKLKAARTLQRSLRLLELVQTILAAYARLKAQRGLLDFEDLIERTLSLLTRADAAWVLYKLDSGIDHILVDEAQDTSEQQWEILVRLAEDFTTGESASPTLRTFFAVGDEKQSIYSFQGAAPRMFAAMRRQFAGRARGADQPFAEVELDLSFRSAAPVLQGVDAVFSVPATWAGVAEDAYLTHTPLLKLPGLVELWVPIEGAREPDPDDWLMPLDQPARADPAVQLAERIARTIDGWLAPGSAERVHDAEGRPRRIEPGDIMILVRSRNAFFEAMIRALKEGGIKAAGADRLELSEHIATMDLVSAGRAALTPDDDLALACLIKSPLIGLDDDALLALAPHRPGALAEALAASREARFVEAERRLAVWRERARSLTPFAFYARLLGEDGGRRALLGRLGPEAGDAIDEFLSLALAHERDGAPSLVDFLQEIEEGEVCVKRDMETSADAVRVMTVHAAKGLEAPIVFLPDTCTAPTGRHDPKLFLLEPEQPGEPPLIAWSPRTAEDPAAVSAARAAARAAAAGEHRRLLYVAMTRAAERLIIAGSHGVAGKARDCWHDMAVAGLAAATPVASPWSAAEQIWRLGAPFCEAEAPPAGPAAARQPAPPPAWLRRAAAREPAPPALNPSRAAPLSIAAAGAERAALIERGRLSHALLQHLPELPADRRRAAGRRFLDQRGALLNVGEREALLERTMELFADSRLTALFGAGSRAEVAVAGRLARPGRAPIPFTGRIDRVAVEPSGVLIADFKSGAPRGEATPAAYIAQLALYRTALAPLYPRRPIRALLVWLDRPEVVEIAAAALDEALDKLSR